MVVHPSSHRISRARRYSGSTADGSVLRLRGSHPLWQAFPDLSADLSRPYRCPKPQPACRLVWPLPRSLATTGGISVDVFSSSYLDVSVQTVPLPCLFDSARDDTLFACRVPAFGDPRVKAYLRLTVAYRSLSRPSSAPDAKASSLRPSSLDLSVKLENHASHSVTQNRSLPFTDFPQFFLLPLLPCLRFLLFRYSVFKVRQTPGSL